MRSKSEATHDITPERPGRGKQSVPGRPVSAARECTAAFCQTHEDVANKDLWQRLLHLVNVQARNGCEVCFWRINRVYNDEADGGAKSAANYPEVEDYRNFDLEKMEAKWRNRPRIVD